MNWELLIPLITGVLSGALTGGLALLGVWGSFQRQLGNLEARMTILEQRHEQALAENIRLHEETREIIRREVRLALQVLREHTHADGSPAVTPIPVEADAD